jgi:hypothetical protein
MLSQIDKEKIKKNIHLVLDRIRTDVDPHLLNEYRRLFKREVSLFSRSWASAYLLMCFDQSAAGRADKNRNRKNGGENRSRSAAGASAGNRGKNDEARNEIQRYPLSEEESKRIFISIGRSRRVFPREILGLINSKTAIPREDIGAIRILDNYSFIQVRDTVAERIIEALNGMNFRGRTLAVNYAKARKDEGAEDNYQDQIDGTDREESGDVPELPETGDGSPDYAETDARLEQAEDHSEEEDIDPDTGQQ